jgi:hypothetical protein
MRDETPKIPFPVATHYRDGTPIRDGYGNAPDPDELARARHGSAFESPVSRLPEHLRNPIQLAQDAIDGRRET